MVKNSFATFGNWKNINNFRLFKYGSNIKTMFYFSILRILIYPSFRFNRVFIKFNKIMKISIDEGISENVVFFIFFRKNQTFTIFYWSLVVTKDYLFFCKNPMKKKTFIFLEENLYFIGNLWVSIVNVYEKKKQFFVL